MSLFGQVWLWTSAAFLIGVLLAWIMLVRPLQAHNRRLERKLREARSALGSGPPRPSRPPAPADDRRRPAERYQPPLGLTKRFQPDPGFAGQYEPAPQPTEQYRPEAGLPHQSQPQPIEGFQADPGATQRYPPEPQAAPEPFWATFPPDPEPHEPQPEPEPEPAEKPGELAWFEHDRPAKPSGDKAEPESPAPPATEFVGLNSVLEPEKSAADVRLTSVFQKIDESPGEERGSERGSLFGPSESSEPEPVATTEPAPPTYAFGAGRKPADNEAATEVTQVLPKRQPLKTPLSAFEPPRKRVAPSTVSVERREPAAADEGGQSGSLFAPSADAGSAQATGDKAPPEPLMASGPFGPGSAMPRPGGGRPADDFAVKASVTALRYCTEGSPQYPRMVAEVWFRTAADAERVGFRPVT